MQATVLLSGGIDSAACVHFLQGRGHDVAGVFVDFGQAAAHQEWRYAHLVSDHFLIPLRIIRVASQETFGIGELTGRNAFLMSSAILLGGCREGLLAVGIHAGTPYFDCSPAFVARIDPLIRECSNGRISVLAPFVNWSKDEVYSYFVNARIPLRKTYSCEAGVVPPCKKCASCKDRARLECLPSVAL
jgi:7-cyano-7-deazaguanine synthase